MIHAYHATFGTYGSWLPNDPRGSASQFVGGEKLFHAGRRSDCTQRTSFKQLDAHQKNRQELLQSQLKRPPVILNEGQINAIAAEMERYVADNRLQVWATAILPCHVHFVFARCGRRSESVVDELKHNANKCIVTERIQPAGCTLERSIWAEGRWIVYLDKEQAIESAIAYVVNNPTEQGRPLQKWRFVVRFPGIESNIVSYRD